MTLVVDGVVLSLQRRGGISVYTLELLRALARRRERALLTLEEPLARPLDAGLGTGNVAFLHRPARLAERWRTARVPGEASVFLSSYYRRPNRPGVPAVVTVHDFTYERFRHGPGRWGHVRQKHAAIRAAQALICVSEATRQDLLRFVGVRPSQSVHVIHNGVSEVFRPLDGLPGAGRPYMLFVGERAGYKNFALALAALERLPELELRCVGGGPLRPAELRRLPAAARARVRHAGEVDDAALNRLYNQATCLAHPSRHEGFGIPVLEAMRAGCPVVAVDCAAVREIGGDALVVAPDEPDAFARAVRAILDGPAREQRVRAGFQVASACSWDATHARTLAVCAALVR